MRLFFLLCFTLFQYCVNAQSSNEAQFNYGIIEITKADGSIIPDEKLKEIESRLQESRVIVAYNERYFSLTLTDQEDVLLEREVIDMKDSIHYSFFYDGDKSVTIDSNFQYNTNSTEGYPLSNAEFKKKAPSKSLYGIACEERTVKVEGQELKFTSFTDFDFPKVDLILDLGQGLSPLPVQRTIENSGFKIIYGIKAFSDKVLQSNYLSIETEGFADESKPTGPAQIVSYGNETIENEDASGTAAVKQNFISYLKAERSLSANNEKEIKQAEIEDPKELLSYLENNFVSFKERIPEMPQVQEEENKFEDYYPEFHKLLDEKFTATNVKSIGKTVSFEYQDEVHQVIGFKSKVLIKAYQLLNASNLSDKILYQHKSQVADVKEYLFISPDEKKALQSILGVTLTEVVPE